MVIVKVTSTGDTDHVSSVLTTRFMMSCNTSCYNPIGKAQQSLSLSVTSCVSLAFPDPLPNRYAGKGSGDIAKLLRERLSLRSFVVSLSCRMTAW